MIKRLRRQLTALFTITTGLILTLVVIGILVISAREFNKKKPGLLSEPNPEHHLTAPVRLHCQLYLAVQAGER